MILIKGGRVIDPEKKKEWKADVALDGQKIAAIGWWWLQDWWTSMCISVIRD